MIIISKVPAQTQPGLGRGLVVPQVHVLILHRSPQPLDHDVVERPADTVHPDRAPRACQHLRECLGGELAALVGVEDRRLAATRQCLSQWTIIRFASVVNAKLSSLFFHPLQFHLELADLLV